MAFFPDLTPHTYSPTGGLELVNVGWLDEGGIFPVGPTTAEFHDALRRLCDKPVYVHRGGHACSFCEGTHGIAEGNGQIRVRGKNGVWYSAPTLIYHYVTHHEYLPPQQFIDAVLSAAKVKVVAHLVGVRGPGPW